ncbi:Sulfotransferase family protein [Oopsacas minuta]|uniref:Protein-tyrosine sulfotransferase n=1 Tax=Oopsacas minuta TaxID=111878 RepID=A0AAV7K4M5_9METZ|nr:Sulfotransferase family protein [Oopsacas minuta]
MILHKHSILNIFLSILVISGGISYIHQRNRILGIMEEMLIVKNSLREKGIESELAVDRVELAMRLCGEEIQTKRTYIDKCIDFKVKQKQNINLTEVEHEGLQEIIKIGQEKLDECFEKRNILKNKNKHCFPEEFLRPEDQNIFRNGKAGNMIKYFVLFIGYARSGHSIVAALLDAHPHIVISHELHAVQRWTNSRNETEPYNRYDLFNEIMNKARSTTNGKGGFRSPNSTRKYYTLDVPGLYQGHYEDYIQIIGDKSEEIIKFMKEDLWSRWIRRGSEDILLKLERFQYFVGCPLKIFHIVRNPYDNIATKFLYGISGEARKDALLGENKLIIENANLSIFVKRHINSLQKIRRYIDYFGERMLTLHHEDLITNPILSLKIMCNHMEIYCSNSYLEKASKSVFSTAMKSRQSVEWNQDMKTIINTAIQTYTFLNRYSFER